MTYVEMEQRGQRGEVRPVQCPTHSLPYKMLCATCETLCCKVCLEMEHLNHKVSSTANTLWTMVFVFVRILLKHDVPGGRSERKSCVHHSV